MSDMWKRLDALAGRAVSAAFGDAVLVSPMIHSEYRDGVPDPDRPPGTVRGIFGLEHGTDDFRGQRVRGEFAGNDRLIEASAHLQITAAEYAKLGYEIVRNDRITLTETTGQPVYVVSSNHPLDCGDAFLILTRDVP